MDHQNCFVHRLCSQLTVTCVCHCHLEYDTLTPTSTAKENNPPSLHELKIILQYSHNQIKDGTSMSGSCRRNVLIDVIENFESYDLVKESIDSMLFDFHAPLCCSDYVTDRVLLCAFEAPVGGLLRLTAHVRINMEENLDVEEDMIDDGVTESMEEDNVRRIRASKSFIDGLKKENASSVGEIGTPSAAEYRITRAVGDLNH
ncbi:hypothetical protein MKW94_002235 [Papaver nudicaule]|uniref:Uncharacterized protein n=1 Tax=Papaver nudicaule TaxID=74823 RepID=A0AA41S3W8_PAPNU|nr:hypothetical protein [Papaver nudicaule]